MSNVRVFSISIIIFFIIGFIVAIAIPVIIAIIVISVNRKKNPAPTYVPPKLEQQETVKTLGETIKDLRVSRNMTQEYVAESLGVSRQAVSKWENGTSEPGTANLVAIAKLFGVEPEELLKKLIK